MAVVKTMITSNGATVRFHDDYLPRTEEENQRRRKAAEETLGRLYVDGALRRFREWRAAHPDADREEFMRRLREIAQRI